MNEFEKLWVEATCAPASIKRIKETTVKKHNMYSNIICNENGTIFIIVISTDNLVIGIGKNQQELIDSKNYSFNEAVNKIAELLNCTIIKE